MKRYIAQFVPWSGGKYAVLDQTQTCLVSDPMLHHEAHAEAEARNNGTFGAVNLAGLYGWAAQIPETP